MSCHPTWGFPSCQPVCHDGLWGLSSALLPAPAQGKLPGNAFLCFLPVALEPMPRASVGGPAPGPSNKPLFPAGWLSPSPLSCGPQRPGSAGGGPAGAGLGTGVRAYQQEDNEMGQVRGWESFSGEKGG